MPTHLSAIRRRMDATGISYAGIAGAWWLPAAAPFVLPARLADDLAAAGGAIFALLDAATELYGTPAGAAGGLDALLEHRVPPEIPRVHAPGAVLGLRPDFQLRLLAEPPFYQLVATELEICPSAHGFAHAMQAGYGLPADLAGGYARLLAGRARRHRLLRRGGPRALDARGHHPVAQLPAARPTGQARTAARDRLRHAPDGLGRHAAGVGRHRAVQAPIVFVS